MKNLILLLLLSPLSLIASHTQLGKLQIRSDNHQRILVEVDGHTINWFPAATVTARNLNPGYHHLQIASTFWSMGAQRQQILFRGQVFVEPNRSTLAVMDRNGRLYIQGQPIQPNQQMNPTVSQGPRQVCATCHQQYIGQHQCGQAYNGAYQGGYNNGGYGQTYPNYPNNGYNGYNESGQYNSYNGYGNTNGYGAMNNRAFKDLTDLIEDASFESTKVSVAKQGVSSNWITSRQLRDILELFSFESTKTDFARWAYDYVVDKQNIHVIYKAFDFESSIQSLAAYFK